MFRPGRKRYFPGFVLVDSSRGAGGVPLLVLPEGNQALLGRRPMRTKST